MGIFDSKATKDAKKAEEQKRVEDFMANLEKRLSEVSPEQAKKDLQVLVKSLVGFFGKKNPALFTPGKEEMWYITKFIRTIISAGTDALMPGNDMSAEMKDFMELFPVIQRYANVGE